MERSAFAPRRRFREGVVIQGLGIYNQRNEAEAAALMMGLEGTHEVDYNGEVWYAPGPPKLKSFREFV